MDLRDLCGAHPESGTPSAQVVELEGPSAGARVAVAPSPIARLRKICLALPEAHEVVAWGEPTFRVHNKLFVMFASPSNHHGGGRPAV